MKTPIKLILIILLSVSFFIPNSLSAQKASAPKLFFDTDMGSDCDDVGALALLHHYIDTEQVDLLACVYSSGKVPFGAGIVDAINTYYGRPDIPIGAEYDSSFGDPVDKMDAEKLAKDTAAFGHDIIHNTDAVEQVKLLRRILAKQPDHSVIYLTVGHTKALHDLLRSPSDDISDLTGLALIEQKLKCWVALGALGADNAKDYGAKDWNFFWNGTKVYTDYLIKHFPREIYFIDAGKDVFTGQSLMQSPANSIVRTAYRDWLWKTEKKLLQDGRPSWDLTAVVYAVEGSNRSFEDAEQGSLRFDISDGSRWTSSAEGKHFYVKQKDNVAAEFADYLNELIK